MITPAIQQITAKVIYTPAATDTPAMAEYTFDIPFFLWIFLFLMLSQIIWIFFKIKKSILWH